MNTQLVFVGLPYAAIVVFIAGLVWRYRSRGTVSSLSSQMLESRWLAWGTVPFHLGIVILFVEHLLPVIAPDAWQSLMSNRSVLMTEEVIGAAAAILCMAGLLVLLVRRVSTASLRASSTVFDVIVLALLIAQVFFGLQVAFTQRWAALWAARTTTPYLWSVFTLRPDPTFLAGMPLPVTLHIIGAWITLALIPFTRLVHMFSLPVGYLFRAPLRVLWAKKL
ncbi:MAG: respiratory nitrate reductase subunit gamma [Thermoanaerobaculia bacterium]